MGFTLLLLAPLPSQPPLPALLLSSNIDHPKKAPREQDKSKQGNGEEPIFSVCLAGQCLLGLSHRASSMSPTPKPLWSEVKQARSPQGAVCPSSLQYGQIRKRQKIEHPTVLTFPYSPVFQYPTPLPHSILGLEKVVPPTQLRAQSLKQAQRGCCHSPGTVRKLRPREVRGQWYSWFGLAGSSLLSPKFLVMACLQLVSGETVVHFCCEARATPRPWCFPTKCAAF